MTKRVARTILYAACASSALWASCARADDGSYAKNDPWSVTLYAGPAASKYFGAIIQSGNFHATSVLFGVTLDRRLIYFGEDIWLSYEAQAGKYWFGHHDTTYGTGLGLLFNEPFGLKRTSFSVYDGPSWDTSPPHRVIGYKDKVWGTSRRRFLNYVGAEFAVGLTSTGHWDGVFRLYHRSGVWGLYSHGDDEGTAVGLGVRYRF